MAGRSQERLGDRPCPLQRLVDVRAVYAVVSDHSNVGCDTSDEHPLVLEAFAERNWIKALDVEDHDIRVNGVRVELDSRDRRQTTRQGLCVCMVVCQAVDHLLETDYARRGQYPDLAHLTAHDRTGAP